MILDASLTETNGPVFILIRMVLCLESRLESKDVSLKFFLMRKVYYINASLFMGAVGYL